jgi:8-oxo-dGTP pyrophosphatase MutT (NUDIX family)
MWKLIGQIAFWTAWPLLYVYLRFSKRTRVFIRSNQELVVVKGWLGSRIWNFPGGGVHRGEDPRSGAVREVYEEIGIVLNPKELTHLFEKKVKTPQGFIYTCSAFAIDLPTKPKLKKPSKELVEIEWRPISELREQKGADKLLEPALAAWEKLG